MKLFWCYSLLLRSPVRHTFQSYPHRFVGIDNTSIFGLAVHQYWGKFSHAAICWCLTRHCCWHRNFPTFYELFFIVCPLNSSSSGSMKKIPRNCLALSSFGFSIAHFCFALLFRCIRHLLPHFWRYIVGS